MLHGVLNSNSTEIGNFTVVRLPDQYGTEPEDMVSYACSVIVAQTLSGNPKVNWRGEVTHRFGDGALALVAKAFTAAVEANPEVRL